MHIFWHQKVPPIEQTEESIRVLYQEHKRKVKDLEMIKKECQDQRQELVHIGTQKLNYEEEKRVEIEQMEDLVAFSKTNVDKYEKRIQDTKTEIEKIKGEKR